MDSSLQSEEEAQGQLIGLGFLFVYAFRLGEGIQRKKTPVLFVSLIVLGGSPGRAAGALAH